MSFVGEFNKGCLTGLIVGQISSFSLFPQRGIFFGLEIGFARCCDEASFTLTGEGGSDLKRLFWAFLGLARTLLALVEELGVACVRLDADLVRRKLCSASTARSQFSTKVKYINENYNGLIRKWGKIPLRGDFVGLARSPSKSIFRRTLTFRH